MDHSSSSETPRRGQQPLVTTRRVRFGPDALPPAERLRLALWRLSRILARTALLLVLITILLSAGLRTRITQYLTSVMPAYMERIFESGPPEQTFGIGSAKEHVRAVQGPPSFETERTWRYGASEVYFAGGHVIGWRAAGPNALKTR